MEKKQILKYLKSPYDLVTANHLYMILRNDSLFYKKHFLPSVEYAQRRFAKGQFDEVLFVKAVLNSIEIFMRESCFKRDYAEYLPSRIDIATKYHTAKSIADYIVREYL